MKFKKISGIFIVILILFLLFPIVNNHSYADKESVKEAVLSLEDCENALIYTYLNQIQQATDDFYSEYYTISPTVAYYSVKVKNVCNKNNSAEITFLAEPYLGPHDTIGKDEIVFTSDYTGKIELKEFNHLKSYALPDHMKNLEKN